MISNLKLAFVCTCIGAVFGLAGTAAGLYFGLLRPAMVQGQPLSMNQMFILAGVVLVLAAMSLTVLVRMYRRLQQAETGKSEGHDWA